MSHCETMHLPLLCDCLLISTGCKSTSSERPTDSLSSNRIIAVETWLWSFTFVLHKLWQDASTFSKGVICTGQPWLIHVMLLNVQLVVNTKQNTGRGSCEDEVECWILIWDLLIDWREVFGMLMDRIDEEKLLDEVSWRSRLCARNV